MLDIKKVYIRQSAPIALKHPETGGDLGCSIWVSGKHSEAFAESAKKLAPQEGKEASVDDLLDFMASLTTAWDGLQANGEDIPFSTEKARELYAAPETAWIFGQVLNAHNARVYPTDFFSGKPPFVTPVPSAITPAHNSDSTPSEKTGEATT